MSNEDRTAVIVGAARLPTGRFLGGLAPLSAPELGARAIAAAVERSGVDSAAIEDVIMGNVEPAVIQTGSPEEVYELTGKVIEKGKRCPGGFMPGPGCEILLMAPEEIVWTIFPVVRRLLLYRHV